MSDLFNLYAEAGSPNGDDQPQSAQRWAADEVSRLRADHERLVEALSEAVTCFNCPEWSDRCEEVEAKARDLLVALEAEKGGEL